MKKALLDWYNKITDRRENYSFCGVKKFCQDNGWKYKVLEKEKQVEEFRPHIWKIREVPEIYQRTLPETYIAEIEDATVFGENDMIMSKGVVLSDEFTHVHADKMRFNKRIAKSVDLDKETVLLSYHYYRKFPIKEAFNMTGIFAFNYYHFLINLLPKLYYLYQCEEYKGTPLLVDKRAYENFKPIIDMFNIHNRQIVCVPSNTALKVKRLIVTSNCAWYDRYVLEKYHPIVGHAYDNKAIQFVRNHALQIVTNSEERRRVYISRRKQGEDRRRLINEDEVEAMFHRYGFITVYPEELSFREQVKLFSETEVFAGVTGAAFTNTIFLPSNATIIYGEFVCGNRGDNLFPSLWHSVGEGRFITLLGVVTDETKDLKDNLRKFRWNVTELEEILRTL